MAGDWMKVEKDTPEKPEIYRIASILGISQAEAFLACFRVWRWADSQTDTGIIHIPAQAIDDNAKIQNFHQALSDVGWLNLRTGAVELPNFVRHMGESAKQRAMATRRQQLSRIVRDKDVTKPSPEKRREEKKVNTESPLPPLPFLSEQFAAAWRDWEQHRKEIGKPLKPTSIKKQFKTLVVWGESRAIAAIEHSIANGYQGIYEPKSQPQPKADAKKAEFDRIIENWKPS